ncbi:hypothetical protein ABZ902_25440 [Streptomyces massasporeus]
MPTTWRYPQSWKAAVMCVYELVRQPAGCDTGAARGQMGQVGLAQPEAREHGDGQRTLAVIGEGMALLWAAEGRRGPGRRLAERRRERWQRAYAEVVAARRAVALSAVPPHGADPEARAALLASLDRCRRICPVPAARPTWIGDRLRAVDLGSGSASHSLGQSASMSTRYAWWTRRSASACAPHRARIDAVASVTAATSATGHHHSATRMVEGAVDLYGREVATALGVPRNRRIRPLARCSGVVQHRDTGPVRAGPRTSTRTAPPTDPW